MNFPLAKYQDVISEAAGIIVDRDNKGRNSRVPFYDGFPHGHLDVSFELSRRVGRILGMETVAKDSPLTPTGLEVLRGDALDLLNYAAFYVMLLDKEHEPAQASGGAEYTLRGAPPTPPLRSI